MLRISNHTACRFAKKTRVFRSLWAGRRCAAASRFTFFKVETLYFIRISFSPHPNILHDNPRPLGLPHCRSPQVTGFFRLSRLARR